MSAKKHTNPAYISHVHLKGYKSIIDTEVELHPGLNIIIGPNGSGKTNFLEFLDRVTNIKFDELPKGIAGGLKFYFKNEDNKHTYNFEKQITVYNENGNIKERLKDKLTNKYLLGKEDEVKMRFNVFPLLHALTKWDEIKSILITFELPVEISNLSKTISYLGQEMEIEGIEGITVYLESNFTPKVSNGVQKILKNILLPKIQREQGVKVELQKSLDEVKYNLEKFTPVSSLRIMPLPELKRDEGTYRFNYLNFEFYVGKKWLSWNQLSDGTKRLFYIISEVTLNEGMCLIEEPEIGIHPDQYRKILNFLKEQSEHKQIIITTHAPKTLDILDDDELNRIILTRYDKELGTKMRHLSKEEQQHAVKFMEEESFFLSDFWTLTSFFDEEEEVI